MLCKDRVTGHQVLNILTYSPQRNRFQIYLFLTFFENIVCDFSASAQLECRSRPNWPGQPMLPERPRRCSESVKLKYTVRSHSIRYILQLQPREKPISPERTRPGARVKSVLSRR